MATNEQFKIKLEKGKAGEYAVISFIANHRSKGSY